MTDVTIFVPTYGRVGDQKFLNFLSESNSNLIQHVTLVTTDLEFLQHKKEWYAKKVKKLVRLPPNIDCIAKKRKWMAHNCDTRYMYVMDDDVMYKYWHAKEEKHLPPDSQSSKLMTPYFLERLPEVLESQSSCMGVVSDGFMAKQTIQSKGFINFGPSWYVMLMRSREAKALKYNRLMFYGDADIVIQNMKNSGSRPVQDLHFTVRKQNRAKVDNSGSDLYRSYTLTRDSMTKFARYHSGIFLGKNEDSKAQNMQVGMRVSYLRSRKWNSYSDAEKLMFRLETLSAYLGIMKEFGIKSSPPLMEFDDDEPRADIIARIEKNWERAKKIVDADTNIRNDLGIVQLKGLF